ncbi:MAG: T9SS type A sorting domain-containing protein, partial [bacterium]
ERFVVRNNLFVGLKGDGAFSFAGPNTAILYNNVFYKNFPDRGIIEINANTYFAGGPAKNIYSFNNIFSSNNATIYRVRDSQSGQNLVRGSNLYYSCGSGGDLNLAQETGIIQNKDPLFSLPVSPVFDAAKGPEQINEILKGFRLKSGSPAIDNGVNPFNYAKNHHPDSVSAMKESFDAFLNSRPVNSGWDMGLHEFGGISSVKSPKISLFRDYCRLNIFPSPSNGLVNIQVLSPDYINGDMIRGAVYDISGNKVYGWKHKPEITNGLVWNNQGMPAGLYTVKITMQNGRDYSGMVRHIK